MAHFVLRFVCCKASCTALPESGSVVQIYTSTYSLSLSMSFSLLQICTSHSFLDQWSFANRLPVPKKEIRTTLEKFLVFFSNQVQHK